MIQSEARTDHKTDLSEVLAVESLKLSAPVAVKLDRVLSSEGITHKVLLDIESTTMDLAMTSCGWRLGGKKCQLFSSTSTSFSPSSSLSTSSLSAPSASGVSSSSAKSSSQTSLESHAYKRLCSRCFPVERAKAKDALKLAVQDAGL